MKFLIDANCHRSIGTHLKQAGHDVTDIRDINPSEKDAEIYKMIDAESRVLITRDTDFGNILLYPPTKHCGIILLRVYMLGAEEIIKFLDGVLADVPESGVFGSLIVVTEDRIRIRTF